MSEYTRQVLKLVVAKICQTIGWHSINSTPLDIMVDILRRYFIELTRLTHSYATQFGHVHPNLDELGLAFRDMHINIADLEEYIQYVESAAPVEVPLYPIPKESHLNFLKPGSNEVVTRPVHIHEHLPPMLTERENELDISSVNIKREEAPTSPSIEYGTSVFKRPADISNDTPCKRPRLIVEEEGRPTREISSVMMTTSGFLSPAREGKLPEARTPATTIDQLSSLSGQSSSYLNSNAAHRFDRKCVKAIKDMKKMEKRKDRLNKELFKPITDDLNVKKTAAVKEPKQKSVKSSVNNHAPPPVEVIEAAPPPVKSLNKQSLYAKQPSVVVKPKVQKMQKVDKHQLPAPITSPEKISLPQEEKVVDGKLYSEPDKVKLNIFKKIPKVKEERVDKGEKVKIKEECRNEMPSQSRESSPDLVIDEADNKNWNQPHASNLTAIHTKVETPIHTKEKTSVPDITSKMYDIVKNSPHSEKDFMYDDYMSPPGTPLTPKTPEMPSNSPPVKVEKKKKKEKNKLKSKSQSTRALNSKAKIEGVDLDLERPKTPDDPINFTSKDALTITPVVPSGVFPFYPSFTGGPGLIPPPLSNTLFPRLPSNLMKHGFGQPAHIPAMNTLPFVPVKPPPSDEPQEVRPPDVPQSEIIEPSSSKEKHKKDKKDKIKKKNKKDKIKNKSEKRKIKEEKREKEKIKKGKKEKKKEKEREHEGSVPKLTLKISSPRPPTPDAQIARKIMIKPVVKKDDSQVSGTNEVTENREPSPELARISALITRPPKLKPSKESHVDKEDLPTQVLPIPKASGSGRSRLSNLNKGNMPTALQNEEKLNTNKVQKLNIGTSQPESQESEENKVWICPACGRQDDGSPMIGCDDCDAWYHWVCVGIQVPPDDNEDWYCRICLVKKQEMLQIDKKKKRKRKEKKNLD